MYIIIYYINRISYLKLMNNKLQKKSKVFFLKEFFFLKVNRIIIKCRNIKRIYNK